MINSIVYIFQLIKLFKSKKTVYNYFVAWYVLIRNNFILLSVDAFFRITSNHTFFSTEASESNTYARICIPNTGINEWIEILLIIIFIVIIPISYLYKAWVHIMNKKQKYVFIPLCIVSIIIAFILIYISGLWYVIETGIDSL